MGIIHECDSTQGVTFIVWDGAILWDDWLKHAQTLMDDPEWLKMSRFLVDMQSVTDTSSIDEDTAKQAANLIGRNREIMARKRGAVVADAEFWRARRFRGLLSKFGTSPVIFNTLDTACLFLSLDLAETRQRIRQMRSKLQAIKRS